MNAKSHFPGFPRDALDFIAELKTNNNKTWFSANKNRYKSSIVSPMVNFIETLAPELARISDCFVADARPHGGSMFRIYRDTRFAKDKTPYKDHVACHFRHTAGKDAHAPGFYFHFDDEQVLMGGGIWLPPNPVLNRIRGTIVDNPGQWNKIKTNAKFRKVFGAIDGEQLKRPPRGFPPEHEHMEDLRRKSYFAMHALPAKSVTENSLVREVISSYRTLAPMMKFLTYALDLPFDLRS